MRAGYILTCLPKTMATSPLPVKSPFLIFTSVSSDLPLPRVAECTLRNFKLSIHFYSTIMVQAPSLTRLQSSRMWLVPGDQKRTAFLSFQFLSDTCYTKEREAKLTRKARCPPRHIPVEAILPVQLGRETRRSIDRVASSSYASTVFSA